MSQPRSRRSRHRLALAVPVVLSLTASLGFLPAAASAAPFGETAVQAADATNLSYVVNTKVDHRTIAAVKKAIPVAGGTVVIAYEKIGVIVAHSSAPDFAQTIRKVRGVESAGATRTSALPRRARRTRARSRCCRTRRPRGRAGRRRRRTGAARVRAVGPARDRRTGRTRSLGSSKVTVAVIDTGVDDTHPDLAPNFDRAASVNCVTGKPDTTDGAWRPSAAESPHGTHVAGEIAAAKNGVGMTGVAPGVKVAGIKVSTTAGYFYTEAVVCGFMWAATHGVDVTNNSYYTDPWYFNCTDDPDQKALVDAVTRASRYAEKRGVVNVAAAGNENYDLAADEITDTVSPNDGTPSDRVIDPSECFDIPTQLPGVVTVAATGAKGIKSSFSNYGLGVIDVAAPGGDSTAYQTPAPPATSGLILGTLPGGKWGYMAGTSMASPHVAAVAALIKSTHPYAPPALVKALLYAEADATACTDPYDINGDGKVDAVCEGSKNRNGFYGWGTVDALDAVTK